MPRKRINPSESTTLLPFAQAIKAVTEKDYTVKELCTALGWPVTGHNIGKLGNYLAVMSHAGIAHPIGTVQRTPGQPGVSPTIWGVRK